VPQARRLNVDVESGEAPPAGTFANAFRVLEEDGGCVLDFLVYTPSEGRAFVVSRVRVSPEFLPLIRDQISRKLRKPSGTQFVLGFDLSRG